MIVEDIARIAHAALSEYNKVIGDEVPDAWDELMPHRRMGVITGARLHLDKHVSPAESHNLWLEYMRDEGYTLGEKNDDVAKTHKNLVPFGQLSDQQKTKDALFRAICVCLHVNPC